MPVHPLLKWLSQITSSFFTTSQRPVFLVSSKTLCEDYKNQLSHLLTTLGANVVNLKDFYKTTTLWQDVCDGYFYMTKTQNKIEICFNKVLENGVVKRVKKSFSNKAFFLST